MKRLIFVASHVGYPMDRTPLGGGAMVGQQLINHWQPDAEWSLTVLGSGPESPKEDIDYQRLSGRANGLVNLGELDYARFCRDFEQATTEWILARKSDFNPKSTVVLVNDISEGPTLERLAEAGYKIASIWHVDVVDYFNKLYLRSFVAPQRLTRLHEGLRRSGLDWLMPDMLNLVFEKQRQTVKYSNRMIMPSSAMAKTLARCYGDIVAVEELDQRIQIVPWGGWSQPADQSDQDRAAALRTEHGIGPDTVVLITLSRISPEKGVHILAESLLELEQKGLIEDRDVRLFICGEPAFMMGHAYARKVRSVTRKLKKVKVVFPGYLDAAAKRAYFQVADLFVSPSVHESYGLNLIEAMRAGLPVLASDHYGARDTLPQDAGIIVEYTSPKLAAGRMAKALSAVLIDKSRLKSMGERARAEASRYPFPAAAEAVRRCALNLVS